MDVGHHFLYNIYPLSRYWTFLIKKHIDGDSLLFMIFIHDSVKIILDQSNILSERTVKALVGFITEEYKQVYYFPCILAISYIPILLRKNGVF